MFEPLVLRRWDDVHNYAELIYMDPDIPNIESRDHILTAVWVCNSKNLVY